MRLVSRFFLVLLVLGVTGTGLAQNKPKASNPNATFIDDAVVRNGPGPATYGTTANTWYTMSAWDAHPIDSSFTYTYTFMPSGAEGIAQSNSSGSPWVHLPVHLPNGSLVNSLELERCDTNASVLMDSWFVENQKGGNAVYHTAVISAANEGCVVSSVVFSPAIQVDNDANSYFVEINMGGVTDQSIILFSVRVGYTLQVSPAPATATFADVPTTHPQFRFVEALAAAGITAGCSATDYCPDAPLTRGQMAVYLSVALGLHWPN